VGVSRLLTRRKNEDVTNNPRIQNRATIDVILFRR